jgi:hypothetical protein
VKRLLLSFGLLMLLTALGCNLGSAALPAVTSPSSGPSTHATPPATTGKTLGGHIPITDP